MGGLGGRVRSMEVDFLGRGQLLQCKRARYLGDCLFHPFPVQLTVLPAALPLEHQIILTFVLPHLYTSHIK